ncbi:MAG TPA: aldo/keto reductase [Phycisphaerae bacterium]
MLYRRFGRTNLQIPVFSCGGMRYQFKWQDTPLDQIPPENQANLEATIRRSLELGINHIETARGYGSSERQLGVILPTLPREKMIIQTKVSPEKDPALFTKNFEDSISRLKLPYVDLLSLHGINNQETLDWSIGKNGSGSGCLAAARAIQKRGLARHIGFSTHSPLRLILEAINHPRDGGFDYINLHWYWIFQQNWPAIQAAAKLDMGVFIISPADKGGKLYDPPQKLIDLCKPLHPLVFNSLFCLQRPEVHTLSIGAAKPTDFDLAVSSLEFLPRAAEILPPILARLAAAYNAAVPSELRDPFNTFPEYQDSPEGMNLQVILWLSNLAKAYDMHAYGQMRYNLLGNGGHWFPGLNAANLDTANLHPLSQKTGIPTPQLHSLLKETHNLLAKSSTKRLSQS